MTYVLEKPATREKSETFVLDRRYVKAQAKEAISSFAAPLMGVVAAMAGISAAGVGKVALGRGNVRQGKPR